MPATATAVNPQGVQITFEEEAHIYYTDKTDNFTSSTGIINQFHEPFDQDGSILKRCAAKREITPEQLQKEWDDNKNYACDLGTRTHENCEYHLTGKFSEMHQPQDQREFNVFTQAHLACEWVKDNFNVLQAEAILFSERFRIAGTIDLLAWDKADPSTLWILDWKTNAKGISMEGFNGKKMFPPVSHINDCHFGHYSLQLGIYQFLMQHESYFPPNIKYRRALIHIGEQQFTPIELPELQLEVSNMILYDWTKLWNDDSVPF